MKRIGKGILLAALLTGVLCLSSCYIATQGSRYLALLSRAVPSARVLSDPNAPASEKELLLRAARIREFALGRLGMRDTKNYKALVKLNSDRLATIVSACGDVSFDRYLWKYPVVGALPYKGFFKPEDAEREAARLRKQNLDVIIRPVDAFSTLGWFADPLFSFMSKYDDAELAETILHELAHATVFVKKDDQFNEEFATFVGRQGAIAYMESLYSKGSTQVRKTLEAREDSEAFSAFLKDTARTLEDVYRSHLSREEKLKRKAEILAERAVEYKRQAVDLFHDKAYSSFPMEKIDNAYLDLYRLYEGEPELYQDFFVQVCDSDLGLFIQRVKELSVSGADPKEGMRGELAGNP